MYNDNMFEEYVLSEYIGQREDEAYFRSCYEENLSVENEKIVELSSNLVFPLKGGLEVRKHTNYLPLYLHTHDFLELCYVMKGHAIHTVFDTPIIEEEGNLFLLPPGVYHTIDVKDDSIVLNILVSRTKFPAILSAFHFSPSSLTPFFERMDSALLIKSAKTDIADNLVCLLIEALKQEEGESTAFALLIAFLELLSQEGIPYEYIGDGSEKRMRALALLTFMRQNLPTVHLGMMSEYFHLSREQIGHILYKSTGATYSELIKNMRLEKAVQMLNSDDLSCKEIGIELGFSSAEHFSRVFRLWTGFSPSEFRSRRQLNPDRKLP